MANFATLTAAEQRAYAKVKDKTWVNAHAERLSSGLIAVRVQRFMASGNTNGGWVSITDDGTV